MSELGHYMEPILVVCTLLAIWGTLYNKKTGNKPGFIIGGILTLGMIGITALALYDLFVGLQ
ncbi:hypothetical protein [Thermoflavimicrobium dichotomicum]|uniref:Uncharacterized protein n=1 Tax=Thermoflavimicrobium dichotomicum TaxID=46223 RepID=A0A1I3Q695_9BACL|nr:hypothetical protein [Thermoflavimicrobium dichotomicum]SFJ29533.1 hypothetical protein SAMN05421852_10736 [Thermoflavimicrobium dichotomicum]